MRRKTSINVVELSMQQMWKEIPIYAKHSSGVEKANYINQTKQTYTGRFLVRSLSRWEVSTDQILSGTIMG